MRKKIVLLLLLVNSVIAFGQQNALFIQDGDHVSIPDNNSVDITDSLTIEMWLTIPEIDTLNNDVICSKGWCAALDRSYSFSLLNGYLNWSWQPNGDCNSLTNYVASLVPFPEDSCVHIAVVHTATYAKIYMNGQEVQTTLTGFNTPLNISQQEVLVGAYYGWSATYSNFIDGAIRDYRMWNTARSQNEIQQNMNNSLTGNEAGLVVYFPLQSGNIGNGSMVSNLATNTGSVNDGTMIGSAATPYFTTVCVDSTATNVSQITNTYQSSILSKVSPNPFVSEIELSIENYDLIEGDLKVVLYDNLGRIVYYQENIRSSSITINGTELLSGIYYYQLQNTKGLLTTGKINKME